MTSKKKIGSAVIVIIGVIGTMATLLSMPDTYRDLRTLLLFICILLIFAGFFVALNDAIHFASAWSLLRNCGQLGITRVHLDGKSGEELPQRLQNARTVKIMVVTGNVLIRQFKNEVVTALKNRAYVKVLLATSGSDFVKDVEEAEAATRAGQICHELDQVEKLLVEYLTDASRADPGGFHGKIDIGHFQTQLRSSLIICDDGWGKLTLSLAPKRAVQTPALELKACPGGLLSDCVQHFDCIWNLAQDKGQVRPVQIVADMGLPHPSPQSRQASGGEVIVKATAFLAEHDNRWYLDFAKHFYPDVTQAVTALLNASSFDEFARLAAAKIEVASPLDAVKSRLEREGFTSRNETFSSVSLAGQEMVSKPKSIYGVHPSGAVLMCPTARHSFDQIHQKLVARSRS